MSYCVYFLFVLGATSSTSMAVEEFRLLRTRTSLDKGTAETAEERGLNETRIQTSYTTFEKDAIVQTMNKLRRTVGASDMTYMYWDATMENDASTYTAECDTDSVLVTNGWGIGVTSSTTIDPVASLKKSFADSKFYYEMRSVYLIGIGVNIRFCSSVKVDGTTYRNKYIAAYLFSHTSLFKENYRQYSTGTACTECRSHVFWCDEGLCRDGCSSQIYTCSCFLGCTYCQDWNSESCTCPSKPSTDADTLNCYNKAETTHKARASMAMIIVSTLALFYLQ